jgi:hypothetical protein
MTDRYAELSDRARWFLDNFDEIDLADICANNEKAAETRAAELEKAEKRLLLAHKARRGKEHQLDGIRRALCDIGFMDDDDPYSHADLADVIRQNGQALREGSWRAEDHAGHGSPCERQPDGTCGASAPAATEPAEGTSCSSVPGCDGQCCKPALVDDEAQRTFRRDSLHSLLGRAQRLGLTWDEGALLRQHVEAEMHDADIARAVAADHRVENRALREKLERYGTEAQQQQRRAAQAERERDEARQWARHGYEIGQRHCGWSDHGVAPAWLTEGWPPHIDSCEHLQQMAEFDTALSRGRAEVARWKRNTLEPQTMRALDDIDRALNSPADE